jgi:membrane-associated phospholipid phosphatase
MPLFVLIAVALAAGGLVTFAARHWPAGPKPVVVTAREAARGRPGRRGTLASRLDPEAATGLALTLALIMIFGGGLVLAALAVLVRESHALSGIDSGVAQWGADHATGASTRGLKLVTDLGETWMAIVVGVAVAIADLRLTRNRWVVPFLLAVVIGDKLLTNGLKLLVDRVRPHLNPVAETLGPSFPSGHSSTAAALWAAVALIAGGWWGRRAIAPLAGCAVALAVAVAASRVLLDVHWLTDVIAGVTLGWLWFAVCAVAFGGRVLRFGATAEAAQDAASSPPAPRLAGRATARPPARQGVAGRG